MKTVPVGQLIPCCTSCYRADLQADALVFQRLPPLVQAIYDRAEAQRVRIQCPSGVRIRFKSNTSCLSIALRYGPAARSLFRGTLVVNGDLYPWGPDHQTPTWQDDIYRTETRQDRLFDLWMPHLCRNDLFSFKIDDDAEILSAPTLPTRWLAFGDSITQGMTANLPTRTHTAIISLQRHYDCWNFGVGGATFDAALATTIPHLPDAGMITIAYGTNDFNRAIPITEMKHALDRILAAIQQRYPRIPAYLITPVTWVDAPDANAIGLSLDAYREAIGETGATYPNITVIDGTKLIPDDSSCFVDKVHPNNRGFAIYADNLAPLLKAYRESPS